MAKQAASRTPSTGSRKKSVPPKLVALESEPSHAEIAARAYGLWLARGSHDGDALSDWMRAESELRTVH